MIIALDIGDTLINRFKPREISMKDGGTTYPLFRGVIEGLRVLHKAHHELIIISKINPGDNEKVTRYVQHHAITPQFVGTKGIHFCHEWDEKGPIAKRLGVNVIVDDRVQVHNTMATCDIPHRILFTEGHDDRNNQTLTTSVIEARNWREVVRQIMSLPQ